MSHKNKRPGGDRGTAFDQTDINYLDKKIAERLGRKSLVGTMKATSKKIKSTKLLSWETEWNNYWYVYVFLIVSAVFTATLGLYMGLSPTVSADGQTLTFHTDLAHVLLAGIFMIAFVANTEGAFGIAKWLYFTREEDNITQQVTTIIMMSVAAMSILGTGVAGGMVIASNISFLSAFVEIPTAAQKWVVVAIPSLITFYTILFTFYSLSSNTAASERIVRETKKASALDNELRTASIEQIASEQLQSAELLRYMKLVQEGRISAAGARAAIRAGMTLGDLEVDLDEDIDGDGDIGNIPEPRRAPQPPTRQPAFTHDNGPQPLRTPQPLPKPAAHEYGLPEVLDFMEINLNEAKALLTEMGLTDPNRAYGQLSKNGMLPVDMTHSNFVRLWNEHLSVPT